MFTESIPKNVYQGIHANKKFHCALFIMIELSYFDLDVWKCDTFMGQKRPFI